MTNRDKEELAVQVDDAILSALRELNIRQSGAIVELVQRFAHCVVDHAELVPPSWQQVIIKTCQLN